MNSIDIITFKGCLGSQKVINELEKYRETVEPFEMRVQFVPSADKAAEMGLYGSPTIVINGVEYQGNLRGSTGFY